LKKGQKAGPNKDFAIRTAREALRGRGGSPLKQKVSKSDAAQSPAADLQQASGGGKKKNGKCKAAGAVRNYEGNGRRHQAARKGGSRPKGATLGELRGKGALN